MNPRPKVFNERTLHAYPLRFSRSKAVEEENYPGASSKKFHSPGTEPARSAILLVDVSRAPQESTHETACLFRQLMALILHL